MLSANVNCDRETWKKGGRNMLSIMETKIRKKRKRDCMKIYDRILNQWLIIMTLKYFFLHKFKIIVLSTFPRWYRHAQFSDGRNCIKMNYCLMARSASMRYVVRKYAGSAILYGPISRLCLRWLHSFAVSPEHGDILFRFRATESPERKVDQTTRDSGAESVYVEKPSGARQMVRNLT